MLEQGVPGQLSKGPGGSHGAGRPEPRGMFNCILSFHPRDARYNLPDDSQSQMFPHVAKRLCLVKNTALETWKY